MKQKQKALVKIHSALRIIEKKKKKKFKEGKNATNYISGQVLNEIEREVELR